MSLRRTKSCNPSYGAGEAAVSGMVAGGIAQAIGFPLDSLKVRTQLGSASSTKTPPLMRGAIGPVATAGAVQSIYFACYDTVRRGVGDSENDCECPLGVVFLGGTLGGLCISPMTCVIARVKILQQSGYAPEGRVGIVPVVRDTLARGGVRSLGRGFLINTVMESGRGYYMVIFALLKKRFVGGGDERDLPVWKRALAGAGAGVAAWAVIYPLDTVKSIVQAQRPDGSALETARSVAARLYREGGVRRLYRGLSVNLIRAGPVAGVLLPLYDVTLATLRSLRHAPS